MKKVNFDAKNTFYASASRVDIETVNNQFKSIDNVKLIDQVFSKIPLMFQILNKERQIIYINELLRNDLETKGVNNILGYRPGEILQCKNAFIEEGGCGTSIHCQYCGIINSVIEAQKNKQVSVKETIFETEINGIIEVTNYTVTSKPFVWENNEFTIVSFENTNDKKRKEQLEKTFFHDLMNKVSSISGFSELLEMEETGNDNQFLKLIRRGILDLTDEIHFQRNLVNAENGELIVKQDNLASLKILEEMKEDFLPFYSFSNKTIIINNSSEDIKFTSDKVLVKRILNNLIKNSLEAVNQGESVTIGSTRADKTIQFWVQNNKVLSAEIKEKMFKRSFSTKGAGRGIGTYSVKLFTEKYLKGKAFFTSDEKKGTIFFVEFPL